MGFTSLIPWAEADAQREQARSDQWRDARRTQTIGTYMATANQIRRQLGYVDNLQKALAMTFDPNTHQPAAGHEQEAARLQEQLKQYDVNALHGNLNQVEGYIQRLYDPNFNETGMPGQTPIRALGEKLHLVKPQTEQRKTAGEMIRDLQGIQQKYDIAAPGIETGEQELASEAAQSEQERALQRRVGFVGKEAKEIGLTTEETQATQAGILGGYKPTAPKTPKVKQIYQATDGKQYIEYDNGEFKTLGGDPVSTDALNQMQLTPLAKGGAANLKIGTLGFFLNSAYGPNPTPEQQVQGSRIWQESRAIERTSEGTIRWLDSNNNWWEIPETRTSKPVSSGLPVPGPYQPSATPGARPSPPVLTSPIYPGPTDPRSLVDPVSGLPSSASMAMRAPAPTPSMPAATDLTGATDVPTAQQSPITGGGPAPTAGAGPTPPVPGARRLGTGKDTPPQVKARENYNSAIGLQAQANQVQENLRKGMPVAIEQHRVVIALERLAAGRFTQQAAQYMLHAGLANSLEQATNQLFGGGELPADVWQQLLRAVEDARTGAEAEMKSAGLGVGKTPEEQSDQELIQRLNERFQKRAK